MLVQSSGLACEPHGSSGMTCAGQLHFCDRCVNKFNQKHLFLFLFKHGKSSKKQGTHSQTPIYGHDLATKNLLLALARLENVN